MYLLHILNEVIYIHTSWIVVSFAAVIRVITQQGEALHDDLITPMKESTWTATRYLKGAGRFQN